MIENLQRYFRYYLALALTGLLALGARVHAAPLPAAATATATAQASPLRAAGAL